MRRNRPYPLAAATAVAMLVPFLTPAASSAAPLPDLVVSALATGATAVTRGSPFAVTVSTKNAGAAAAAASTTRFSLSIDKVRGAGDRRLTQVRPVARLGPGATSTGTMSLRPAATTPDGFYYVIACADDLKVVHEKNEQNNCRATSSRIHVMAGATSIDLIDQDLADGLITPNQALEYRVFSAFGDSRLPAKYHGDDASVMDSSAAVAAAAAAFDTASPQVKAILIPFLKPPAYPNTWENLATAPSPARHDPALPAPRTLSRGGEPVPHPSPLGEAGWAYYQQPHGVRIWFHQADQHQHSIARFLYFAVDDVWKLTTLMGRAPASDAGLHPYVDPQGHTKDWGNGGSGDLDIYLATLTHPAITLAYPPGCTDRPSFITIDDSLDFVVDNSRLTPILAHEFMHVLQFRFHYAEDCDEYTNLDEATAQWAIDYVAPGNDFEHHTDAFLPDPDAALWRQDYDGWPFELFLAHTAGPATIAQIYANAETMGPWEAVDAAVPGGLAQEWPLFSLYAWNQPPITNSFAAWDKLKDVPVVHKTLKVALGGQTTVHFPLSVRVGALAREYDVINVADDVAKLEFHNGLFGKAGADVFALLQLATGAWRPIVNWTTKQTVTFCRHTSYEKVKKIILVTADHTFDDLDHAVSGNSEFVASKTCQYAPKLDGTIQWTTTKVTDNDFFSESTAEEGSATLHLVPDDPDSEYYVPEDDGTSTFEVTYSGQSMDKPPPVPFYCVETSTWSGSAEGVFSTYGTPVTVHLGATVEPDDRLGPDTDVIAIYVEVPVVVAYHTEEHGTAAGCDRTWDDEQDKRAPFIDAVAFHCEPGDVADGPYTSSFVGKWHPQERTFRFDCTEDVDDGFGTTGTLTVTGQLTAT